MNLCVVDRVVVAVVGVVGGVFSSVKKKRESEREGKIKENETKSN